MTQQTELDQAIKAWSSHNSLGAGDEAALLRILERADADAVAAGRQRPVIPLWLASGAIAASVAIALLVTPRPQPEAALPVPTAEAAAAAGSEGAAFALLYTPTFEEEYQL